jgi:hypothetical protein
LVIGSVLIKKWVIAAIDDTIGEPLGIDINGTAMLALRRSDSMTRIAEVGPVY